MKIQIIETDDSKVSQEIFENLKLYNISNIGPANQQGITVSIHDDSNKLMGGIVGFSQWDWIYIKLLWVDEKHRGKKLGATLVKEIEKVAINRNCKGIYLDTFDFQAPLFYEKMGFILFGEIKDYPVTGKKKYFYKKNFN